MSNKREQIIATTCQLIETQGYQATGLNQIVAESGAPKGSLYHYFPDGKDGLVEEAIAHTRQIISDRLQEGMAAYPTPAEAIPNFLRNLAHHVQASGFQAGGPITAVALEAASTNERLNAACRAAYQEWQAVIEQKLLDSGYEPVRARRLGAVVIALIEGAIILSRSERNVGPLLDAALELEAVL
ncbi:MAG: putative HTH-type transcriptional regulator YxaF [Ardenticatenaceae bacterium]|nr:MAG: putative HTH-type transcriptional regulator YxaF [Ardenticatenaceae bacterium]